MNWEELLQKDDERVVAPWLGGKHIHTRSRVLQIKGRRPTLHGWYEWKLMPRHVELIGPAEPQHDLLLASHIVVGYLVGDRIAPDDTTANFHPDATYIAMAFERVHLVDDGIERFSRISAGRVWTGGPLVFRSLEMPLGPESDVLTAFYDRTVLDAIKGVTPALYAAFAAEVFHRAEAERIRVELERRAREEAERRAAEERRANLIKQLGDGAGRREMARVDFQAAARAALAVGGAELLDCRRSQRNEYTVTYRVDHERLQCVVDETMHVVDAGVCLQDHRTGRKGDTLFTLESLPAVIREAIEGDKLVKWRHV